MDFLWRTDWGRLFTPEMSLLEILVRGTLIYLALCLLLRVVLKRQAGKVSLSDLLVVTLVAGVCRNPLVRDDYSVTDGVLVVATVLFWSFALDWLSYYVPFVHKLLHAAPVPLVRDGKVLQENLRRELLTESQLDCKLRRQGVREPAEVAEAWMEGDGHVSVIKKPAPAYEPVHLQPPAPANGEAYHGAVRRLAQVPERGDISGAMPDDPDIRAFLEAARKLEAKAALHQQAIAEHEREAAVVEEVLSRYGFRMKRAGPTGRARKAKAPPDAERS